MGPRVLRSYFLDLEIDFRRTSWFFPALKIQILEVHEKQVQVDFFLSPTNRLFPHFPQ